MINHIHTVDVDIDDRIRIHADGMVVIVLAADVIESVREINFLHQELEKLRDSSIPIVGIVAHDGSVQFLDGLLDEPGDS